MKESRAIFINTVSQIGVRIITLVFTLISIKLLTNYLGVVGVGNLNTITAYVNYFLVVADLGLFSVTVREISKNPKDERKIISNVFFIRLVSALAASFIAVGIIFFTPYRHDSNLLFGVMIACGFLFFNLMGSIGDMILQYRLKMQFSALAEFLSKIISLGALITVILLKGNFLWVVFSSVALSGIMIFILKWYFATKYQKIKIGFESKLAKWIFDLAWPMGIVFIANNLYFRLDSLMLFVIKGAGAVGIYSVAYKILEVTVFFGSYFASSLKPILSRNITDNKEFLKGVMEKSFLVMLFISLPVTVVCMAYSREIITFLSNSNFAIGGPALVVLSMTLPFLYFDVLLGEILIAHDERKLLLKISAFILSFNFLFNLMLIPHYSYMGAAYGTLISEIILFFIFLHYTKKIVPYKLNISNILKLCLIAFLALIFTWMVKIIILNFVIGIVFSLLFFLLMVYVFGLGSLETIRSALAKK
jgi:O-antigen/teichoic acid export membrane protein